MQASSACLCDRLGRQRTLLGDDPDLQSAECLLYIHIFFHCTYGPRSREERKVAPMLRKIRTLGDYIWILAATAISFTQLRAIKDFEENYVEFREWTRKYPYLCYSGNKGFFFY
jgi:hypothetical protein